jgi:hypothetical protein
MKYFVALAFIIVLDSISAFGSDGTEQYAYIRWIGSDRFTIEPPVAGHAKGQIVEAGHAFFDTDFCAKSSEYFCYYFFSHFAFAVPKVMSGGMEEWTVQDVHYRLVERDVSVRILGRRIDSVFAIRRDPIDAWPGDKPWIYLYSAHAGLLALGTEDLKAVWWLEGDIGFGSAVDLSPSAP